MTTRDFDKYVSVLTDNEDFIFDRQYVNILTKGEYIDSK